MGRLFKLVADNTNPNSISGKMRRIRFEIFTKLLNSCPENPPITILDLGGDLKYWVNYIDKIKVPVKIILLNLYSYTTIQDPRIKSIAGDARDLSQFEDKSINIIHSNSLIEHLGTYIDQKRMADEVRRVSQAYFVQTPNRYFPIEPHFLLPFFQFLPSNLRAFIARKYRPGWFRTRKNLNAASEEVNMIHLLNRNELQRLFPDGQIWKEKLGGLTKSIVVYKDFIQ